MSWVDNIAKLVDAVSERVNLANWTTSLVILFFAFKLGVMLDRLDLATMEGLAETAFATFKDLALLCAGYLFAKVNGNSDASV